MVVWHFSHRNTVSTRRATRIIIRVCGTHNPTGIVYITRREVQQLTSHSRESRVAERKLRVDKDL